MKSLLAWCKKECRKMLPVVLFFLLAFSLVDITKIVAQQHILGYYSFFSIVIASLIMGKVVLIADELAVIELCENKPLIYATVWKSFFYVFCSIILRLIEHVIPAIYEGTTWTVVYREIVDHAQNPLFWVAQMWLAYLFVIFVGYRELVFSVGPAKVRKLFFGPLDPY